MPVSTGLYVVLAYHECSSRILFCLFVKSASTTTALSALSAAAEAVSRISSLRSLDSHRSNADLIRAFGNRGSTSVSTANFYSTNGTVFINNPIIDAIFRILQCVI
jgi:hypothetical protein